MVLFAGRDKEMYAFIRGLHAIGEHHRDVQFK